jgi:hypothetical protein
MSLRKKHAGDALKEATKAYFNTIDIRELLKV